MAKATKRAELNDAFIADLSIDWQANGAEVIERLRQERPEIYASLVAKLVPQRVEVSDGGNPFETMTGEEVENWLVNSFAEDITSAERIIAKARELAASGDAIVTIIPDEPTPASVRPRSRFGALPVVKGA